MQKKIAQLDNLQAFIEETRASANVKKDIQLIRETYDLTQEALAAQFGVSQKAVSRWLRGECQPKCKILIHLTAEKIRSSSA